MNQIKTKKTSKTLTSPSPSLSAHLIISSICCKELSIVGCQSNKILLFFLPNSLLSIVSCCFLLDGSVFENVQEICCEELLVVWFPHFVVSCYSISDLISLNSFVFNNIQRKYVYFKRSCFQWLLVKSLVAHCFFRRPKSNWWISFSIYNGYD